MALERSVDRPADRRVAGGLDGVRARIRAVVHGGRCAQRAAVARGARRAEPERNAPSFPISGPTRLFVWITNDRDKVFSAVRGELVAAATGAPVRSTGVQIAGVLDDLYADAGRATLGVDVRRRPDADPVGLGADRADGRARAVRHAGRRARGSVAMRRDDATGVWSAPGARDWNGKYYRYRVTAWQPAAQKVVTASVTDPYSVALAADSTHSQIVDLDDPALRPGGLARRCASRRRCRRRRRRSRSCSVRDFSIADAHRAGRATAAPTSPSPTRTTAGMTHLRRSAEAGVDPRAPAAGLRLRHHPRAAGRPGASRTATWPPLPPDSDAAAGVRRRGRRHGRLQLGLRPAALHRARGLATPPTRTAPARTVEFRQMVAGLNGAGLRVVMDVVYNHTVGRRHRAELGARPDRARLLPAAARRRHGRQLHLLRQHRARARDDGQARRRLDRHLGQGSTRSTASAST